MECWSTLLHVCFNRATADMFSPAISATNVLKLFSSLSCCKQSVTWMNETTQYLCNLDEFSNNYCSVQEMVTKQLRHRCTLTAWWVAREWKPQQRMQKCWLVRLMSPDSELLKWKLIHCSHTVYIILVLILCTIPRLIQKFERLSSVMYNSKHQSIPQSCWIPQILWVSIVQLDLQHCIPWTMRALHLLPVVVILLICSQQYEFYYHSMESHVFQSFGFGLHDFVLQCCFQSK